MDKLKEIDFKKAYPPTLDKEIPFEKPVQIVFFDYYEDRIIRKKIQVINLCENGVNMTGGRYQSSHLISFYRNGSNLNIPSLLYLPETFDKELKEYVETLKEKNRERSKLIDVLKKTSLVNRVMKQL